MKNLFLSIILVFSFNQSCVASKEVKAVVEEFPNYIFHLLTLGGIVADDPEYNSLYGELMSKEDREYFIKNRHLLAWGNGNAAPLINLFLFIPGYINLQTQSDINEYFDLLSSSLKNREFKTFVQKYEPNFKKLELWGGPTKPEVYLQSLTQYAEEVSKFGDIYKNNFQSYHLKVWPKEKEKLEKTAKVINEKLQKLDLITHWEKLTGKDFKFNKYEIVLFSANKNGTSANSLGYERNTFYHGLKTDDLLQNISHEVGTHILIDSYMELKQMNRFNFQDLYMAFENVSEFYNVEFILKGKKPLIGYDVEKYCQMLKDIYNSESNISPTDLMIKGVETYDAQKK